MIFQILILRLRVVYCDILQIRQRGAKEMGMADHVKVCIYYTCPPAYLYTQQQKNAINSLIT